MSTIITAIDRLTDTIGRVLSWLCLLMMLITVLVVVLRYVFHSGNIIVFQESVTYLHATIFLLALGWALKHDGHVRVDVFYRTFPARKRAWINALGTLVFLLPFCVFMFFASLDFVSLSWSLKETSAEAGGLPFVFLLKTLIPLMCVLLAIQGIAELLRNLRVLCFSEQLDEAPNDH